MCPCGPSSFRCFRLCGRPCALEPRWSSRSSPCDTSSKAELSSRTFCSFPCELSSRRRMLDIVLENLSSCDLPADHHFHVDHGPHATALRPPASESRPTLRGRDRRDRPRRAPLDGASVAARGANRRRLSGYGGPHGAGTPAGGPQATSTVRKLTALLQLALPCCIRPGFGSTQRDCRTDATSGESCVPWIGPASTFRCERSCGSCVRRRVGFMAGTAGSARVGSTIGPPVRAQPRLD